MKHSQEFEKYRPLLFAISYRMLGSAMDAEDMVQETFYRWEKAERKNLSSVKSFLTTIVTNLCIDYLRSAKFKREEYIGTWLPEPLIINDKRKETNEFTEVAESLSTAFLVLLESLTPVERAVYLLHDIFGYDFSSISEFLNKREDNCRQIAKRARDRIKHKQSRFSTTKDQVEKIVNGFIKASNEGKIENLMTLLEEDIVLYSDGGGKVTSARKPVKGNLNVAKFVIGLVKKYSAEGRLVKKIINGLPGIEMFYQKKLLGIMTFEFQAKKISNVFIVVNPEKLKYIKQ